jgi:ribose transport system ATP-binding protein
VVYVSHRIPEVLAVADDLTVLRDGAVAYSGPVEGLDEAAIVTLMTGAASAAALVVPHPAPDRAGQPVLRARGLAFPGVGPLDLDLHPGEVVGVAGLLGSGRSRLLRALSGQLPRSAGVLELVGRTVDHRSPRAALADGIAYVPEDRAREAAFADRPLWENVSAIAYPRFVRPWGIARRAEKKAAMAAAGRYAVRAAHADVPFASLSGGNQQKAVLARTTWTDPRVLLLDEPSQGVDAMARREIHALVRRHVAEDARAALVVSSDFAELAALCDRVLVVAGGRVRAELTGVQLQEDVIAHAAHTENPDRQDPR